MVEDCAGICLMISSFPCPGIFWIRENSLGLDWAAHYVWIPQLCPFASLSQGRKKKGLRPNIGRVLPVVGKASSWSSPPDVVRGTPVWVEGVMWLLGLPSVLSWWLGDTESSSPSAGFGDIKHSAALWFLQSWVPKLVCCFLMSFQSFLLVAACVSSVVYSCVIWWGAELFYSDWKCKSLNFCEPAASPSIGLFQHWN